MQMQPRIRPVELIAVPAQNSVDLACQVTDLLRQDHVELFGSPKFENGEWVQFALRVELELPKEMPIRGGASNIIPAQIVPA